MKRRSALRVTAPLLALVLLLSGCLTQPKNTAPAPAPAPVASGGSEKPALKVALVTASGGLGDRSFNDMAWAGLQQAEKSLGIQAKVVEPTSVADYATQLSAMASDGYAMVIGIGFDMKDAVTKVAPQFANVKFVTINVPVSAPNVATAQFSDHEGSFLAGVLAASMTKTKTIGFVGGVDAPNIRRFLVGYEEGAKYANPQVKVLSSFVGSFGDPIKGKEFALQQFSQGADIVFHAAGKTGEGVIAAAKDMNKYAIGVDQDQDYIAPGRVLTSMVKRVDVAVLDLVKQLKDGTFQAGIHLYGLQQNGVGLSEMKYTKQDIPKDVLDKVEKARQAITSGDLKVTDATAKK